MLKKLERHELPEEPAFLDPSLALQKAQQRTARQIAQHNSKKKKFATRGGDYNRYATLFLSRSAQSGFRYIEKTGKTISVSLWNMCFYQPELFGSQGKALQKAMLRHISTRDLQRYKNELRPGALTRIRKQRRSVRQHFVKYALLLMMQCPPPGFKVDWDFEPGKEEMILTPPPRQSRTTAHSWWRHTLEKSSQPALSA